VFLHIKKTIKTTAKIVVGFYSLLALLADTISIVWPPGFHDMISAIQIAFASVADLSTLACALPINLYGQVCLWCGVLVVVFGTIALYCRKALSKEQKRSRRLADDDDDDDDNDDNDDNVQPHPTRTELLRTYKGYAHDAALILYPFLSRAATAVFNCREVDGIFYVEADYTLRCDSKDWHRYLAAAGGVFCSNYVLCVNILLWLLSCYQAVQSFA
jgi:hypothetical protein